MRRPQMRCPLLRSALLLAAVLTCATPSHAAEEAEGGEGPSREQVLGFAAARADAFLNLTTAVYAIPVGATTTLGDLLTDARTREGVEAALRAAPVAEGPAFTPAGVVRVTVELNTDMLPYDLRGRIRNLPRSIRIDGVASLAAAVRDSNIRLTDLTGEVKAWAASTIEAEGQAAIQAGPNAEQAKQLARNRAMSAAFSVLAGKAGDLLLEAGLPIKDFLAQHDDLRPSFNAALVRANLASESVDRQGTTYKVSLSLPASVFLRPLHLGLYRSSRGRALTEGQLAIGRRNAIADGRAVLKSRVYALPFTNALTLAKYVATRQNLAAAADSVCWLAQVENVEVTDDGLTKVWLSVSTGDLPPDIRSQLSSSASGRIYAIGGGLPEEPVIAPPVEKPAAPPDVPNEAAPEKPAPPAEKVEKKEAPAAAPAPPAAPKPPAEEVPAPAAQPPADGE